MAQILVVDDDPDLRACVAELCMRQGHSVLTSPDGRDGLQQLRAHPGGVDLVVLDVLMPRMDGRSMLDEMQLHGHDVPVVVGSAVLGLVDLPPVAATVKKPYNIDHLMNAIDRSLRTRVAPTTPMPAPQAPAPAVRSGPVRIPRAPSFDDIGVGTMIDGRYRLEERLSEGGYGVVFRARHTALEADVAIKILRTRAGNQEQIEGLRREGVAACRVTHPNAVRVHDFGVLDSGVAFLAMEMLEGHTLAHEMETTRPTPTRIAQVLVPVCNVLAHAHARGLVHRDIKPANIVISRGATGEIVKVIDFGIARFAEAALGEKVSGNVAGTVHYMPPEVLRQEPHDGRADVFSLGVTFYDMLVGRPPFNGKDSAEVARAILEDEPVRPSRIRPGLGAAVDELALDMLRKTPSRRPTANEAATRLRMALLL